MQKQKHIPSLDGLRGSAILSVMLVHLAGGAHSQNPLVRTFGTITRYGWTGVTLFFVLSGFLITGILWDSRESEHWWRNFFVRRSLRIFPLYYATLLIVFVVMLLRGRAMASLRVLLVYGCYLQNVMRGTVAKGPDLMVLHFWSLAVEEQFYLIWPWLLSRQRNLQKAQTLCLMIVGASLISIVGESFFPYQINETSLLTNAGALALGGWLSLMSRGTHWSHVEKVAPGTLILGLIGFGCTAQRGGLSPFHSGLPFLWVTFGSLLVLSLRDGLVHRIMIFTPLRWAGTISYGLYVFHVPLITLDYWIVDHIVHGASREMRLGLVFILGMLLSFLAAIASFQYFEKPFLSLKKRFPAGIAQDGRPASPTVPLIQ